MEKSFTDYFVEVGIAFYGNPEWRWGQSYFNALVEFRPELAEYLTGTEVDCFYRDDRVPAFLAFVEDAW